MNNSIKRYKVYCISEATFHEFHSTSEPTECPYGHAIDTNQTTIVYEIPIISKNSQTLIPKNSVISSKNYQDLKCDFYFNKLIMSEITNVKVIGYGNNTYSVRAFDITNNNEIISNTLSNTEKDINDLGYIENSPTQDAIIEFHTKVDNPSNKAYIENIIVYYR